MALRFGFVLLSLFAALAALVAPTPPGERVAAARARFDVRILRDTWGVPHVFGRRDADAAFGLAYAHAEDDFATIQQALLAARGTLAAHEGPAAAPNDYLVQLMRVWEHVEAGYAGLAPETRALVEAYAAGLEHYAALHPGEVADGVLPLRGEDVVAGFVHKMPLFFGLHLAIADLLEPASGAAQAAGEPPRGSNVFAVAPGRTPDGHTRLAVNSHQPWDGPVAWYEAHVHSEEGWDMVGGVFPGAPVILHGHNRDLGWAFTVNVPDLIDVYALASEPDARDRYRFDGASRELEKRTARIRVKLLGPLSWTFERDLLESVHGPVLRTPRGDLAVRWAGRGDVRALEQWYRMNRARSFGEWKAAMSMGAIPSLNAGYADREGNVFYVYNARFPRRAPGFDWRGILPGDTSETLWSEYVGFDELPQVENPPSGFVQNCNSSPFRTTLGPGNPDPAAFAPELGVETGMTNRSLRALELLGADASIDAAEFEAYKFDLAYSAQGEVAALVARILAAPEPDDPLLREARRLLASWDLRTDPESRAAALGVLALEPVLVAAQKAERGLRVSVPDPLEGFAAAAHLLRARFGRLDVAWGEVNRLRRGGVDLAVGGGPDTLHAVYHDRELDGRLPGVAGDSYVLLVDWDERGRVRSRSIHQYGSATLDARSPHFADQAPVFARRELKPVWMDRDEIRAHLAREYFPGEELAR